MKKSKSFLATKIAFVVLALYLAVTLIAKQVKVNAAEKEKAALAEQVARQRVENLAFSAYLDEDLTDDEVIALAREKLGMVFSDELVFIDLS